MPEIADVVIVGGGILGTLLAYEFSLRSVRVVLLEANALASGTTGSSFGWINASTKDENEDYHRFNADAVNRWRTLRERDSKLPGIHGGGALTWAQGDPKRRDNLRRKANRLASWGYPTVTVSQSEMFALEPALAEKSPYNSAQDAEGIFFPSELWIETGRVVRYLAELARKRAADIREYTPILGIGLDNTGRVAQVRTGQGNLSTRKVILAAGNATPSLLDFLPNAPELRKSVPLISAPGILLELPPSENGRSIERVLSPDDATGLRLRPTRDGGFLLGADSLDECLKTEPTEAVSHDAPDLLISHTIKYASLLSSNQIFSSPDLRVCDRVMPADELSIVGRLPDIEGIIVAVTHSGITLAPLIAALLAEETLTGKLPMALRPYSPARFLS